MKKKTRVVPIIIEIEKKEFMLRWFVNIVEMDEPFGNIKFR